MKISMLNYIGDRLGWLAYVTVLGGGKPYLPALFSAESESEDVQPVPGEEAARPVRSGVPYAGSMPLDISPALGPEKKRGEQTVRV